MKNFHSYCQKIKWFVLAFMTIILVIVIPVKLHERNYGELFLAVAIAVFLCAILFGLLHFFNSMAVDFTVEEEWTCFLYANGKKIVFRHMEVQKVEKGTNRYTFFLTENKRVHLSLSIGRVYTDEDLLKLKQRYPCMTKLY
ncbi:MAG: hypothetical protein E7549_05755 [Ruminococcaceae bacterium]|nr:hypothetical protein [Oscillospiraceae bacterium]